MGVVNCTEQQDARRSLSLPDIINSFLNHFFPLLEKQKVPLADCCLEERSQEDELPIIPSPNLPKGTSLGWVKITTSDQMK